MATLSELEKRGEEEEEEEDPAKIPPRISHIARALSCKKRRIFLRAIKGEGKRKEGSFCECVMKGVMEGGRKCHRDSRIRDACIFFKKNTTIPPPFLIF